MGTNQHVAVIGSETVCNCRFLLPMFRTSISVNCLAIRDAHVLGRLDWESGLGRTESVENLTRFSPEASKIIRLDNGGGVV
jgi:hypothetical protein